MGTFMEEIAPFAMGIVEQLVANYERLKIKEMAK
jgi:hypothetical protein